MTQADNIRPYAIGVKYKILRDDVGIVPYVIYIINCSLNPNLSFTTKNKSCIHGYSFYIFIQILRQL